MHLRRISLLLMFGIAVLAGYWVAKTAVTPPDQSAADRPMRDRPVAPADRPLEFRSKDRIESDHSLADLEASAAGALVNQRVLVFGSQEALEAFLKRAKGNLHILGRLDALNALRIGFDDPAALQAHLDGDEEISMIFPVEIPQSGALGAQPGAVPLGNQLLAWLGIEGMPAAGDGVRIAVLDTGIVPHAAFSSDLARIDLVPRPGSIEEIHGHGTAVASMIVGQHGLTPGVAPNASIIDVRVANDFGTSNSWLLAEGILAAVDAGAQIINISLGSNNDSALVRNALAHAESMGVVVVAAAGNQGQNQVAFPAANPNVVAVGATDASGNHVAFSNTGKVDISAPGLGVNAAWPGDAAVRVDGTSFSAPIVAGSLAWIMSTQMVSAQQALVLMQGHLNDAGAAGPDASHGGGLPALDRIANRNTSGIFDAAVASHHISPPEPGRPYAQVEVVIQNRGTEPLLNTLVQVNHPNGNTTANITSLRPGDVHPVVIPIPNHLYQANQPLRFESTVTLQSGKTDTNPANNNRVDLHHPPQGPNAF